MTDETLLVNRPFASGRNACAIGNLGFLMNVLAGPGEQRAELIRVDNEINNERHWCQHEHKISHGFPLALTYCRAFFPNESPDCVYNAGIKKIA